MNTPPFYGVVPPGAGVDSNALFGALLEFQWRGQSYPTRGFTLELRQDLAVHKFADRDGAHVENTGRAPLQITVRIPFINGLQPGRGEHWTAPLYPQAWRRFFADASEAKAGDLQHPELGVLNVKLETARTSWTADARGGVEVDASWIESLDVGDDGFSLEDRLLSASPYTVLQTSAAALDRNFAEVDPSIYPAKFKPSVSFSDLAFAVRGVVEQPGLLQHQLAGKLDAISANAQSVIDAAKQAGNCLNWPLTLEANRLIAAARAVKATLLTRGKPIGLYKTPKDSTLAQIASTIGASVSDVVTLNVSLISLPVIPKDTVIRFYK